MISFYISTKRFYLRRKSLFEGRDVSLTKKEYGLSVKFV